MPGGPEAEKGDEALPETQREWRKYFDAVTVTKLAHIGFKPSGLVEGNLVGEHRSPFHGFAIEFAGHRGYVPGDDIKHIDWKAYYKTDKYLIKQYEQETNFLSHLVVDISESMKFEYEHGKKLDYAAFIATALSQVIINQSDTVGACFFDNKIRSTVPVSNSEEVVAQIASLFDESEAKDESAIGQTLNILAENVGRRRIIFVISDFFGDLEDTFRGVKRLLDDRHEVVLLQIVDPLEMDFNIPGRVKLLELEGTDRLDIMGINIQEAYNKLFNDFLKEFREMARALGVDHILCDTSKPFGFHLAEYMSARMAR